MNPNTWTFVLMSSGFSLLLALYFLADGGSISLGKKRYYFVLTVLFLAISSTLGIFQYLSPTVEKFLFVSRLRFFSASLGLHFALYALQVYTQKWFPRLNLFRNYVFLPLVAYLAVIQTDFLINGNPVLLEKITFSGVVIHLYQTKYSFFYVLYFVTNLFLQIYVTVRGAWMIRESRRPLLLYFLAPIVLSFFAIIDIILTAIFHYPTDWDLVSTMVFGPIFLLTYLVEKLRNQNFLSENAIFSTLFEHQREKVLFLDPKGKLLFHNQKQKSPQLYKTGEIPVLEPWEDLALKQTMAFQERVRVRNGKLELEGRIIHKDNHSVGTVLVWRDIASELLFQKKKELVDRAEQLGILAASVAHDFRNLLAVLGGRIQLIEIKIQNPAEDLDSVKKEFHELDAYLDSLSTEVENLLEFSRLDETPLEKIDLKKVLSEYVKEYSQQIPPQIHVVFSVSENPGWILGNKLQLKRVFFNLFSNAIDAMDGQNLQKNSGVSVLSISLENDENSPAWIAVIKDTGVGISEVKIEEMFKPFRSTKITSGGTGLGMYLVKKVLEHHSGEIRIDSKVGQGTEIRLFFKKYEKNT